ncbi:uncharacterized protein LOC129600013 [Paramacrobiotus metropolitanus]|uniref:uncharacterized protein LOC129600013 n=1 Tax=Paramacrobiotus metropolitanus TaxID=2943436 RepID=UPI00244563FD|nr:uncharacterized protein LOC129600013 [Paramacrobiotus metropolitanus]
MAEQEQRSKRKMGPTEDSKKPATKLPQYFVDFASHSNVYNIKYRNRLAVDTTKYLNIQSDEWRTKTGKLVRKFQKSALDLAYIHHHQKAMFTAIIVILKKLLDVAQAMEKIKEHCLSLINGFEHLKSKLNIEKMTIAQEAFLPIVQEISTVSTLIADRYLTQSENGRDVTAALNKLDIAINLAKNALHGDHPEVRDDPRVDDVGESDSEMSTSDDD